MKMKMKNLLFQLLVLILVLILPGLSFADAPMPTLESLTKDANSIVIAKVESVTTEPFQPLDDSSSIEIKGDKQVANAKILDVWKGSLSEKVQFRVLLKKRKYLISESECLVSFVFIAYKLSAK